MTPEEVYQYFKSGYAAAKAIGISNQSFSAFMKNGYVPLKTQRKIEKFTNGKLTIGREDLKDLKENYLPNFRYYDKKHGMCHVESIRFRKGKAPKITYMVKGNNVEKFASFNSENLMQATELVDINGNSVFEGDIIQLENGKKLTIESFCMKIKINKNSEFIIIGNIFE